MGTGTFNDLKAVGQTYEYDHFAGSQVGIYIGDVFVDEINRLQFAIHQAKRPIYGYASQYYDAMASGQVIVSGTFTINFKESGYMHIILKRYGEIIGAGEQVSPFQLQKDPKIGAINDQKAKILRQNIERILEANKKKGPTPADTKPGQVKNLNPVDKFDEFSFYDDLSSLPDNEFENIAEVFEDAVWKQKEVNKEDLGNITKPSDLALDREMRRPDQFPGFTIWVTYGDINNELSNHTVKKLTGVHIVSTGQTLEINGEPILEQYEFIARNVL
jgi:hypothetical protein